MNAAYHVCAFGLQAQHVTANSKLISDNVTVTDKRSSTHLKLQANTTERRNALEKRSHASTSSSPLPLRKLRSTVKMPQMIPQPRAMTLDGDAKGPKDTLHEISWDQHRVFL